MRQRRRLIDDYAKAEGAPSEMQTGPRAGSKLGRKRSSDGSSAMRMFNRTLDNLLREEQDRSRSRQPAPGRGSPIPRGGSRLAPSNGEGDGAIVVETV